MTIEDINKCLSRKNRYMQPELMHHIKALKEQAISSNDDNTANILWCYETICKIQHLYLSAFMHLKKAAASSDDLIDEYDSQKSKEYETAWNELDQCDINIGFLEECFCIPMQKMEDYSISPILDDIKKLQQLFPYRLFGSREMIVKEQRCSICGRTVSVRHPCGHVPGKLYCGEMCEREITNAEFICEAIVSIPFDKYAIIKMPGQKFNFDLLDFIVPKIDAYCEWSYVIEKRLLPDYKNTGRNDKCPCGSGLKFKYCLKKEPELHYENHYRFSVS